MISEIAKRYGEALFLVASEKNKIAPMKQETLSLLELFKKTPDLSAFFRAVKVTREEKKALILDVFGNNYEKEMVHFMELLVDKDRMDEVILILEDFISRCNEALKIKKAVVYSPRSLDTSDLKRIEETLAKKTGYTIELENKIDVSLIAGIKVVMGNQVTDISMKHKIDSLKESLLEGGLS